MPSFGGLLIVVAVAFAAPFVLGLFPRVMLPSVVLEIVAGIVIGPSVLGIVDVDQSIEVISVIGLAFLVVGWWRHRRWYRGRITIPVSAVIAALGLYAAVQRAFLPDLPSPL